MNRRNIKVLAGILAAMLVFTGCAASGAEGTEQTQPEAGSTSAGGSDAASNEDVEAVFNSIIRMDTHLHVDVPMSNGQTLTDTIDLRAAMENAGMNAIGMTFAVDYVQLTEEGQAYDRFLNALTAMDQILKDSGLERTLTAAQMKENYENRTPIVIQEVEGAHFLEGDVSRLQVAYDRGVRILDLFHDNDASPALGDVYTNEVVYGGLTELGEETIRECERLGILVDLAHASDDTVRDALEVATKPILISHTGLNTQLGSSQMAQFMLPRLISPELAQEVAEAGGVIGIWPHLADSPEEYAANIKAMVDVAGIDHVTIGTDSKITPEYDERSGSFRQAGSAANHVWNDVDDNFYYSVVSELVGLGFTQEDIYKICGGNFLRVFEAATGSSVEETVVQTASYTHIDQETAKEMMEKDDGHVIVDVRRQDEYDDGHIPGAILVPNESIGTVQPDDLPDLDQIILIYCRSGNRSKQAAQKLADMGYTNVYEFGGIIDWTGELVKD